jgi:hypothetical protein
MLGNASARDWLTTPPIRGRAAFLCGLLAVVVPTSVRMFVDGHVTGFAVTPYVPFMLLSAILLVWNQAVVVALSSAAIADALFVGTRGQMFEGPSDLIVIGIFVVAAAMMIGFVHYVRNVIADLRTRSTRTRLSAAPGGIIFSLEKGEAWASWYGGETPICLGPEDEVAEMMRDFLAQRELGKRLMGQRR